MCKAPTTRHSGREPCPYDVAQPGDLPGVHAINVTAALAPGEKVRYALYSPIWDGRSAPFGISAEPASHAVVVGRDRFVISRDVHRDGASPGVRTVPFSDILYVQLGSSFCLGWLAVLFAAGGKAALETMLFPALGRDHFAAAVREYRSAVAQSAERDSAQSALLWDEVWMQDRLQAERTGELLVPGETPISALHSHELWAEQRGLWKRKWTCLSREGLLVLTNAGILHVARETYNRPVTWNIGMNVVCVPGEAVQSLAISTKLLSGRRLHYVQIVLARADAPACLEVPVAEDGVEAARGLSDHLLEAGILVGSKQVEAPAT